MALLAVAETAPLSGRQAATATPVDAKEMAAVERIRTRIDEQMKKAAKTDAAPYKVTIPNTTVDYSMVPVPAGEFLMGAAGPNARPDEQPQHKVRLDAFWMQAHEVTWDAYLLFMFADQAKESTAPDAMVDGLSRPTAPFVEMSFGRGNNGFPAISMTQHAANKFAEWLSAKTGEFYRLPTEAEWEYACKAGTETGIPSGTLADYAWFAANSPRPSSRRARTTKSARRNPTPGASTTCSGTSWNGRWTSMRRTPRLRHRTPGSSPPLPTHTPSAADRGTTMRCA